MDLSMTEFGSIPVHCANCGSPSASMVLEDQQMISRIQEWIAPRLVQTHDIICTVCWAEARAAENTSGNEYHIGKQCALCQIMLPQRARSHQIIALRSDTQRLNNIKSIFLERLLPLEVRASHYICHPCWQRADRAAKHYSSPSTSRATSMAPQLYCANCHINVTRMRRHILLSNETILIQVRQRVSPQVVSPTDYICDACYTIFNSDVSIESENTVPLVGHHVCIKCGRSVLEQRHHNLLAERHENILDDVQNLIHPREIQPSDVICHRCFLQTVSRAQADTVTQTSTQVPQESGILASGTQVSQESVIIAPITQGSREPENITSAIQVPREPERITLPNYSRAPDTHSRCIFPACTSTSQQMVPLMIRVRLFSDHNYYVPPNCRICIFHLENQSWSSLFEAENRINRFTATQIEDFCNLLKNDKHTMDFEKIESMDDNMVWYWLGRTKQQFSEIKNELPDFPKRAIALATYLIKLRTGESDDRISTLLNISKTSVSNYIKRARDALTESFVPRHLGLNHLSRQEAAEKNLYIPNSLFGNPGSLVEDRKAIAIMDGTYIYVEKSTNYSYQKKTYSLHKYRNLVKPFMIVCCDGHIIDILGPYSATKSDADILKEEFSNESKPLRQYFREGAVFILDRGFRDSISLIESLNYSVHYPLSLEQGEYQLSTEKANESRKVTLCRWVVEVVNGRFKRDFKLLRQEYFNKASKHLMIDFKVAAALINRFHPVLTDREDAREIVSIIQEKMFTNNILADFVEQNNLNRRRAPFVSITVESNNLREFPQMNYEELLLIPLGVYQLKQARSYYGEHVRQDGSYIVEVCREVDVDLLSQLESSYGTNRPLTWLLRGKIKSRHINHKTYFVYILIDIRQRGRHAILQYCCNCIVGRRTIGCCAHVMTIIWFLSWARHQAHIVDPPAQFLDNVLLENID